MRVVIKGVQGKVLKHCRANDRYLIAKQPADRLDLIKRFLSLQKLVDGDKSWPRCPTERKSSKRTYITIYSGAEPKSLTKRSSVALAWTFWSLIQPIILLSKEFGQSRSYSDLRPEHTS